MTDQDDKYLKEFELDLQAIRRVILICLGSLVLFIICCVLFGKYGGVAWIVATIASFAIFIFVFGRAIQRIKVRTKKRQNLNCSYCRDSVPREAAVACPSCKSSYHPECFATNHGCATFGCARNSDILPIVEIKK